MIEAFAKLLFRAELNPTHENLADIFWLARFLPAPAPPPEKPAPLEAGAEAPAVQPAGEQPKPPFPEKPAPIEPASARSAIPTGELYPRVARALPQATRQATPIRAPATKALPNALEIGRALRPLARRYPSRRLFVMDDEATAERIAEGGPMTPLMRPMNERWFEADVVVDGSPSMVVWHRVVREFLDLLAQQGAFTDVRRWTLSLADAGLALRSPSGVSRRPGELKDPAARRLIFVLTDGVGEAWREDGLPRVLANWARTTPVVIVQMLPERLWPRTAIGVPSAAVWSPVPGVANAAMMIERPWWDQDDDAPVIPIVPITLEAASIQRWAKALMGAAVTAPAIIFAPGDGSAEPARARPVPDAIGALPPQERVQRFRAMVSREAYDLAVFLSAVPLTLPVIGLVQRELLPETRQVHLAEVFVGGIIERVTPQDVACDPEQIEFDFADGVRDILQDSLRRSEAVDVLVAISKYVERHFGQALDFAALIADPEGAVALPEAIRPFARIGMQTYQRFLGHVRLPPTHGPAEGARPMATPILINVPPLPDVFVDREAELKAALDALLLPPSAVPAEEPERPARVFVSYAHKDERLFVELQTVLKPLRERHRLEVFDDTRLRADEIWGRRLQEELQRSDVFLLLVSPDWLASEFTAREMEAALRRAADGSALVIPIIAEECDWHSTPLQELQALPKDGRALGADATTRTMRWLQLAEELEKAIYGWRETRRRRQAAAQAPRVVALTGPDGIGKFTLARRLVHQPGVRERYPDGILWLNEDEPRYPRQWLRDYCKAADVPTPFDDSDTVHEEKFRALFAPRRVLFIADYRMGHDILPVVREHAGPGCTVLVLSAGAVSPSPRTVIAVSALSPEATRELLRALDASAELPSNLIDFATGNPLLLRLVVAVTKVVEANMLAKVAKDQFAASKAAQDGGRSKVSALLAGMWAPSGGLPAPLRLALRRLIKAHPSATRFAGDAVGGDAEVRAELIRLGLLEDLKPLVRVHPLLRTAIGGIPEDWDRLDFSVFRDVEAPWCPEMVVIPAGTFLMGSPPGEKERSDAEGPQHKVTIGYRFALGRYAVTVGQYRQFVEATGHRHEGGMYVWTGSEWKEDATKSWQDPGFAQAEQHPVVGVNWRDAVAYCEWLAKETGEAYRLPSEAEWEYACRAGTTTPFSFGATISPDQANYDGNYTYGNGRKGEYRQRTVPVGSLPANPWGLYEMHGNVWEWVADVWHDSYQGAPADGSAWTDGEGQNSSSRRVLRGGSWGSNPRSLRSALRGGGGPDYRDSFQGFRVARTLY